jgi:hypothetical protein
MAHQHIAMGLVALSVSSVAMAQQQQQRPQRVSYQQAQLICNGRANAANLSSGHDQAIAPWLFGMSSGMRAVYAGCMAEYGYQ